MGNEFTNKILKLALPITAQQFMLALVSACDAFMLGGLNQNSLSAVSLASQITFVFNLILTALTIGENMFVAQYYGKRDFDGSLWLPPMISPIPGTRQSTAATVFPSSLSFM